jgi:UDP-N-acetylmuramyl-tripeptide synthetase
MMGKVMPSGNTTPGPVKLLSMLSEMVKKGAGSVIMEVSSHSLDQHRVDGVSFDSAIFTNISSEHLDYHKTIDDYFKAKRLIFKRLKESGVAVINNDDKRVASLRRSIGKKVVTYGVRNKADITAKDIELSVHGSSFKVVTPETEFEAVTRLIGMHNISNILAGVAATSSIGLEPAYIKKGIESMVCVPGRLEPVGPGGRFRIFVDYAHTPDALFSVLRLLRDVATKDIITVFGCGGNRDRTKRPVMGRVACELSDRVIITSDNPRFEEPGDIIDEIEDGIRDTFSNYEIITDRRDAIAKALKMARKDSVVIIAGKGHENYQIIKDRTMPFDDRLVVRDMLKNKP